MMKREEATDRRASRQEGVVNVAFETVDRQVAEGRGQRPAVLWLGRGQQRRQLTYADLQELGTRAAAALRGLGIGPGDVVACMMQRVPELFVVAIGAWKVGAVFCPLFATLGPGPIKARLQLSRAKALITCEPCYVRRIAGIRPYVPTLQQVLLIGDNADRHEDCRDLAALMAEADPETFETAATTAADPACLHFTSGTTGIAKGVTTGHGAVAAQLDSARQVFSLGPDDVMWCTGNPGWVTWTAYGMVAPLAAGCVTIVDEATDFDPHHWYTVLHDEKVSVWYTTPTAIRMLMRHGAALARSYPANSLRVAASVGEPLNAEAVTWGEKALGVPFLDTWWQTELGAIAVANLPSALRAGSMGRPLAGVETAIGQRTLSGFAPAADTDQPGELALRASGLPSMFTGYLGDPSRFGASFGDGWYLSGDLVRRDAEGYLWFVGRSDDMIVSSAQSIGPFEVESTLMDHPAVAEVGLVGKPDLLRREVPVAFAAVNPGFEAGEKLRLELLDFARQQLGTQLAPEEIHFVDALPKTATGKILRRALRMWAACETGEEDLPMRSRFEEG
jgi:acetyl-CoA synthetase